MTDAVVKHQTLPEPLVHFFGVSGLEGAISGDPVVLLGNKGAQLRYMADIGLPVPPGFTVPTWVSEYYYDNGELPPGLDELVRRGIAAIRKVAGYGVSALASLPPLVSVRSGAAVSMPGMMDTILNVGLNDSYVAQAAEHIADSELIKFTLDSYRRLLEMFGENVYGIDNHEFAGISDSLIRDIGVEKVRELSVPQLGHLIAQYKSVLSKHNARLPQDMFEQVMASLIAVLDSGRSEGVRALSKEEGLDEVYTAVTVQAMVFGNFDTETSGTGVVFTRNPETGENKPYGDFGYGRQGEDLVRGTANTADLEILRDRLPEVYAQLLNGLKILEQNKKYPQDVEFTVMHGKLFFLQTRNARMSGKAVIRSSIEMYRERMISEQEVIERVQPEHIEQLLHPMIDYAGMEEKGISLDDFVMNTQGTHASPGGGVGHAVFDVETALQYRMEGKPYVLFRRKTDTKDVEGMFGAQAVVTSVGGKSSHAAVVLRGKGVPTVVGTSLEIDYKEKTITYHNSNGAMFTLREGDVASVDGSLAKVFNHKADLTEPDSDDPNLKSLLDVLKSRSQLRVFANANDAYEAEKALQFGAEGIGLARTEYMFLEDKIPGENRALTIQSWILESDEARQSGLLARLGDMQARDFSAMYQVMGDLPIIIRLLDFPLHELLPEMEYEGGQLTPESRKNITELSNYANIDEQDLIRQIETIQEVNPMLGHRAVRLGITHPEVYRMQVQAIFKAASYYNRNSLGNYVTARIEIPLVTFPKEVQNIASMIGEEAHAFGFVRGGKSSEGDNRYALGVMFETAGASEMADELAAVTDFGSFGTNDLTQTVLGLSREDASDVIAKYVAEGIYREDPFITISEPVASSMATGVKGARSVSPAYEIGICGEHAANPESIIICYRLGLNNVSPAPKLVPIAWLMGAKAALGMPYKTQKSYERGDLLAQPLNS